MARIYQRNSSWCIDYQINGNRHRFKVPGDRKDAEAALDAYNELMDEHYKSKASDVCENCISLRKKLFELRLEMLRMEHVVANARGRRWRDRFPVCRRVRFSSRSFMSDVIDHAAYDLISDMT